MFFCSHSVRLSNKWNDGSKWISQYPDNPWYGFSKIANRIPEIHGDRRYFTNKFLSRFRIFFNFIRIRRVWWYGSKSHRMRVSLWDMSHVKSYAWQIGRAQFQNDSKSRLRGFLLRWLTFWAISVFMIVKVSLLSRKHVMEILSHLKTEPSWFLMHMTSRETCLIRILFEPSHHTLVCLSIYRMKINNMRINLKNMKKRNFFCWICPNYALGRIPRFHPYSPRYHKRVYCTTNCFRGTRRDFRNDIDIR